MEWCGFETVLCLFSEQVDYKLQVKFEEEKILPLLAQTYTFLETIENMVK